MSDPIPLSLDPFATTSRVDPLPSVAQPEQPAQPEESPTFVAPSLVQPDNTTNVVLDTELNIKGLMQPEDPANAIFRTSEEAWRSVPDQSKKDDEEWYDQSAKSLDAFISDHPGVTAESDLGAVMSINGAYLTMFSGGYSNPPEPDTPERLAMLRSAAVGMFGAGSADVDTSSTIKAEASFHKLAMAKWTKDKSLGDLKDGLSKEATNAALVDVMRGTRTRYTPDKFKSLIEASDMNDFDAGMMYDKAYTQASTNIAPFAAELATVFSTFEGAENYGGFAENMKRWMPGPSRSLFGVERSDSVSEAAFKVYDSLPAEKKGDFMKALGAVSKLLPPKQAKNFMQGFLENASGAAASVGRAVVEGTTETGLQIAETMPGGRMGPISGGMPPMNTSTEAERKATAGRLRAENLRRINFAADVRRIASSRDMVEATWGGKDNSWFLNSIETGLLAAPEAIGTTVVAAVPYVGLPATAMVIRGKTYESMRQALIDEGMDTTRASSIADDIAPISMVPEMLLEKLQVKMLTGGSISTKWITKAWTKSMARAAAKTPGFVQYLARATAAGVEEAATETAQDISQQAVRDAYRVAMQTFKAEATKEMPGVDWGKFMSDLPANFVQNLAAVGPMGIVSGLKKSGNITRDDIDSALNEIRDETKIDSGLTSLRDTGTGSVLPDLESGSYVVSGGSSNIAEAAAVSGVDTDSAVFEWIDTQSAASERLRREDAEFGRNRSVMSSVGLVPRATAEARREFATTLHSALQAISEQDPNAVFRVVRGDYEDVMSATHTFAETTSDTEAAGGDTGVAAFVSGWSETTITGGSRSTVNTLVNGANVLTAFHEYGHGVRQAAVAAGVITREDQVRFFRALDRAQGTSRSTFLQAGKSDADLSDTDLSEAFSGLMEARGYEAGRNRQSVDKLPSLIRRNLSALMRLAATPTRKFIGLLTAARNNFGLAVIRAARVRKAIASGEITKDEIDDFVSKIEGAASASFDSSVTMRAIEFSRSMNDLADTIASDAKDVTGQHKKVRAVTSMLRQLTGLLTGSEGSFVSRAEILDLNTRLRQDNQVEIEGDATTDQLAEIVDRFAQETVDSANLADVVNMLNRDVNSGYAGEYGAAASMLRGRGARESKPVADAFNVIVEVLQSGVGVSDFDSISIVRQAQADIDNEITAITSSDTTESSAMLRDFNFAKTVLDMTAAALSQSGMARAQSRVAIHSILLNGPAKFDPTSLMSSNTARLLDRRFDLRESLASDAGGSSPAQEAAKAEHERDSARNKAGNALASLRSFAGVMRAAFGNNSKSAQQIVDGLASAELSESKAKYSIYNSMNNMLATLWIGVTGRLEVKGYRAYRAMVDLNDVSQKRKVGIFAERSVDGVKEGMFYSQAQAIHAIMMYRQSDGRSHMNGHGYDDAFIASLDAGLTPQSRSAMEWLTNMYSGEMYDRLNKVFKSRVGTDMPKIPFYCPLTVKPDKDMTPDMVDPVTGASRVNAAGFTPASLITRVQDGKAEPDLSRGALDVFRQHVEQVEHWIAFSNISELMVATLADKSVQGSVKANAGSETARQLTQWANYYYSRGDRNARNVLAYHTLVRRMLNNLQGGILMGRIGTLIIQSMNMFTPLLEVSVWQYIKNMIRVAYSHKLRKTAWESDFMLQRRRDSDTAIQEMKEGMSNVGYGRLSRKLRGAGRFQYYVKETLGNAITTTDALFSTIAYANVFASVREQNPDASNEMLHAETVRKLDQVLQPTRTSQRSFLEIDQGPFLKSIWAFASEPRQKLSYMLDSTGLMAALTGDKSFRGAGHAVTTLAFGWLMAGAMQSLIRTVWKDAKDDDDEGDEHFYEDWNWRRMIADTLLWPLDGLPVLGDGLQSMLMYGANKVFDGALGPVFKESTLLDNVTRAGKTLFRPSDFSNDWAKYLEDILGGSAIVGSSASSLAAISHLVRDLMRFIDNITDD